MLNTVLKNNTALMTIICNIQNMSSILKKDISFEYLESKRYCELMEIQENLRIEYNNNPYDKQLLKG